MRTVATLWMFVQRVPATTKIKVSSPRGSPLIFVCVPLPKQRLHNSHSLSAAPISLRPHRLLHNLHTVHMGYFIKTTSVLARSRTIPFHAINFCHYSNTAMPNALVSRYPSFVEQLQLRMPVRLPVASASFICTSKPIIVPAAAEILSSGQATSTM